MHDRCYNPDSPKYPRYGGRGIYVCERWHTFENYYADMGDVPDGMSVDRIDNDGPYSPDNCRIATWTQQRRNSSRVHVVEYMGIKACLAEWSERTGLSRSVIQKRLKSGKSVEEALTTPLNIALSKNAKASVLSRAIAKEQK
jgi:hypothetical protein